MEFTMISSVLAVAMAAWMQPADTTRASREAFTACLRNYVDQASGRTSAADFATAYPQQCTAEQTAFHAAIVRRERASRASAADAEESATLEIEDARTNFSERFAMNQPAAPTQQAAATPAATATPTATTAGATTPAATPTATPAATPAAATTPQN
jgi:hypothetical protein